jgi:hypothetical protein
LPSLDPELADALRSDTNVASILQRIAAEDSTLEYVVRLGFINENTPPSVYAHLAGKAALPLYLELQMLFALRLVSTNNAVKQRLEQLSEQIDAINTQDAAAPTQAAIGAVVRLIEDYQRAASEIQPLLFQRGAVSADLLQTSEVLSEVADQLSESPAVSLSSRIVASLIDGLTMLLPCFVLLRFGIPYANQLGSQQILIASLFILGAIIALFIPAILDACSRGSIGRRFTQTQVKTTAAARLGLGRSVLRHICKYVGHIAIPVILIPLEIFLLRGKKLHEVISQTEVIRAHP